MKKKLTRRYFFGLTSAAAVGTWFSVSDSAGPRFVKQAIQETRRRMGTPKQKPAPSEWSDTDLTATWLGHATVLINFYGIKILTDPVLMPRIGANIGFATIGPKRLVAPPLQVSELPEIDLVLLSHAHMDHFDLPTLSSLPRGAKVVTAHDTSELLGRTALGKDARELRWGQSTTVETKNGEAHVEAFEVQHWGSRWKHDKARGYNGYILERGGRRIMFGGDTAMTDKFRLIRGRRPIDLAMMPIGSYKPFKRHHCDPEESVAMTNDAGAERMLPIHFKTFRLGEEGTSEPLERLEAAIGSDRVALRDIGETFRLS
jgi:L-ascorbate metabolism protein UlaG (beta-lactamase superfamily)